MGIEKTAFLYAALLVASVPAVAAPVDGTAPPTPAPAEFLVGPVALQHEVNGTSVTAQISDYFQVVGQTDGLHLVSRIEVDLSDLQQKFPSILGALPLPSDNCGSYKPDNLVVTLPTRDLRAEGDHALMAISGKVDVWTCLQNPIPNSKIEWEVRDIGFGIKTKVPVLKTWPGNPIKNKSATQPFDATLPIYLQRNNDQTVAIVLGTPKVNLTGQYVFITKGILSLANIDINDEARKAIDKAISPDDLAKTLPSEFADMHPVISEAKFYTQNGQLFAHIKASALIPPEKITEWITLMMKKK